MSRKKLEMVGGKAYVRQYFGTIQMLTIKLTHSPAEKISGKIPLPRIYIRYSSIKT